MSRRLQSVLFVALLAIILAAAGYSSSAVSDGRPRVVQEGATIVSIDRVSGALNPIRYKVEDVDGGWLFLQLMKKSKNSKKGQPFWVNIDDIGPFVIE